MATPGSDNRLGVIRRIIPPGADLLTREFGVADGSVLFMAAFLGSAGLGVVRQILFNAQFGAGAEATAYYAAFRLPDTLFSLIAGGALSSAMVPVLLATAHEDGAAAAVRLVGRILTALLVVLTAITALAELTAPAFVTTVLAPGFPPGMSALTVTLTRIMLLQPLVLGGGTVIAAVLTSRNRFLLPALSLASHNFALIAGLLLARLYPPLGIYGPTLGVVGGAVTQVLVLLLGMRRSGLRFRPEWAPGDRRLREVVRLLIPNGLSVTVNYAGFILDTAFASEAPEAAGLAAVHNAWLLAALPVALLGTAIGQAVFPRLAAHVAAGAWAALRRRLLATLAIALSLAVPAGAALILGGRLLIHVLFEHGRFDAAAGALTYAVLAAYALALPVYVAGDLLTRGLIALHDTRTPLLANCVQFALRWLLLTLLVPRLGILAVPLAFAVASTVESALLAGVLWFKIRRRLAGPLPAARVRVPGPGAEPGV